MERTYFGAHASLYPSDKKERDRMKQEDLLYTCEKTRSHAFKKEVIKILKDEEKEMKINALKLIIFTALALILFVALFTNI